MYCVDARRLQQDTVITKTSQQVCRVNVNFGAQRPGIWKTPHATAAVAVLRRLPGCATAAATFLLLLPRHAVLLLHLLDLLLLLF
jgi:hypothetical protein